MVKSKKYDKVRDQTIDFLQDYFLMYKNKQERDGGGKPTSEYNRLIQAKKRLVDTFDNSIEGSLLFSELVQVGQIKHRSREQIGAYNKIEKSPTVEKLKLYFDEKDEPEFLKHKHKVHDQLNSLQIDVTQKIFTEDRMRRLLESIFQQNHAANKDMLTEDQIDYYANVASFIVRFGIHELKKYVDIQYARLLFEDLEKVEEICRIIQYQKNHEIHTWV